MNQAQRRQIISNISPRQKENAQMVGSNPRAAKGIDKWYMYELATKKAGKEADPLPYQYLED